MQKKEIKPKPLKSGKRRTNGQREEDFPVVAEFYKKGYSYKEIAEELRKMRGYSLSVVSIGKDVRTIVNRWRKETSATIHEQKAVELQKLNKVESEAWKEYEKNKSPAFLAIIIKCIESRTKIFGIGEDLDVNRKSQIVVVSLPSAQLDAEEIPYYEDEDEDQ